VINYTIYENKNSDQWVTFVHGAGSSSIWFKQIRDFRNNTMYYYWIYVVTEILKPLKNGFQTEIYFSALANDILEVLDFLK
jgi:hypothetical protein